MYNVWLIAQDDDDIPSDEGEDTNTDTEAEQTFAFEAFVSSSSEDETTEKDTETERNFTFEAFVSSSSEDEKVYSGTSLLCAPYIKSQILPLFN